MTFSQSSPRAGQGFLSVDRVCMYVVDGLPMLGQRFLGYFAVSSLRLPLLRFPSGTEYHDVSSPVERAERHLSECCR